MVENARKETIQHGFPKQKENVTDVSLYHFFLPYSNMLK